MRLLDFAGPAKQDAKALLRELHNLAGGSGAGASAGGTGVSPVGGRAGSGGGGP